MLIARTQNQWYLCSFWKFVYYSECQWRRQKQNQTWRILPFYLSHTRILSQMQPRSPLSVTCWVVLWSATRSGRRDRQLGSPLCHFWLVSFCKFKMISAFCDDYLLMITFVGAQWLCNWDLFWTILQLFGSMQLARPWIFCTFSSFQNTQNHRKKNQKCGLRWDMVARFWLLFLLIVHMKIQNCCHSDTEHFCQSFFLHWWECHFLIL